MKNRFFSLSFFLLGIMLIVSCDKKRTPAKGEFMIVHAAPGLGALSVSIDGNSFGGTSLSYPANTGYRNLEEGSHVLKATESGAGTTLFEGSLSTIANAKQTLFFYDRSTSLKAFAVVDNLAVPAAGKARVRFFNLSPNSPVIDAGILSSGTFTGIFTARAFEDNVSAINNSLFQAVDAGTVNFQLRVNGAGVTLLDIPSLVLESGKSYTLFAKGVSGDPATPLGLEVITNN
jgi:Domain of unknown function (DUF4397)